MATYNAEKYLKQQLQSLFDQTDQDFFLTIRDNCSTDGTVQILRDCAARHPGKVTVIEGKENLGAKGNFAYLASVARGEYVMFSDADDVWLPHKIEVTRAEMRTQENRWGKGMPLLVFTDKKVVDQELNLIDSSFWNYARLKPSSIAHLNRLLVQNCVSGCTVMANRALMAKACPIPTEAVMHDWWLALVACAFGRVSFLPEPTMLYRQHGGNVLGAKGFRGLLGFARQGYQALKDLPEATVKKLIPRFLQAESFLNRFEQELSSEKKAIVEAFLSLRNQSWRKRNQILYRHQLYPKSFLHKCYFLLVTSMYQEQRND